MRYLLLVLAFVSFLSANNLTFNSITYPAPQGNFLTDSRHGIIRSTTCGEWNHQEREEEYYFYLLSYLFIPFIRQGGFIEEFYRKSSIGIGDEFLVIPQGSITKYYDKYGIEHRY